VHPRAARIFRENPERLSLTVHGNDHTSGELGRPRSPEDCRRLLAQSLARIRTLERKSGLTVDRIMVAPHGECSREMTRAMAECGFEALCSDRSRPWLPEPPPGPVLAGWEIGEVAEGLPVIPRWSIRRRPDEVVLKSYLDQPLVIYGHHGDLADGWESFLSRAGMVNSLGPVRWTSIGEIALSNVLVRPEGTTLRVRAFARRFRVRAPEGVERLLLEGPVEPAPERTWATGAGARVLDDGTIEVSGEGGEVTVEIRPPISVDPTTIPLPPVSPWPWIRRALTEGRDRVRPLLGRWW